MALGDQGTQSAPQPSNAGGSSGAGGAPAQRKARGKSRRLVQACWLRYCALCRREEPTIIPYPKLHRPGTPATRKVTNAVARMPVERQQRTRWRSRGLWVPRNRLVCARCMQPHAATRKAHTLTPHQMTKLSNHMTYAKVAVAQGAFEYLCTRSCRVDKSMSDTVKARSVIAAINGTHVVRHGMVMKELAKHSHSGTLDVVLFSRRGEQRDTEPLPQKVTLPTTPLWERHPDPLTGQRYYVSLKDGRHVWEGTTGFPFHRHPHLERTLHSGIAQVILDRTACELSISGDAVAITGPEPELGSVRELLQKLVSETRTNFLQPRKLSGRGVHPVECPTARPQQKRRNYR
eukprot:TRINITY_DN4344_c0_g1_i1.p1 TRINITY_DN4344_c0_g1~~TRINITY_DN4344_c0_g1_i1.p1  ORF type:complete len:347 (+),score=85.63 TRINITY_DN4344_c0_g1_i1:130-1170(+)